MLFKRTVQPAEIGKRLKRELTSGSIVTVRGRVAPNDFTVLINPVDFQPYQEHGRVLAEDLTEWLDELALASNLTTVGVTRVRFERDETVRRGRFDVRSTVSESDPSPVQYADPGRTEAFEVASSTEYRPVWVHRDMQWPRNGRHLPDTQAGRFDRTRPEQRSPHRQCGSLPLSRRTSHIAVDSYRRRPAELEWNVRQRPATDGLANNRVRATRSCSEPRSVAIGTNCYDLFLPTLLNMELSSDTLYQIVRILFALSLLGFLYLVVRVTMNELQLPMALGTRARPPQPRAELISIAGEDGSTVAEGLVFDMQGVATLGRADSARIVLDDTSVSAHHAMLRPMEGGWAIEDLGSRNGTMVNGRPVTSQVSLTCGDAIQLGRVRLRLMC